MFLCYIHTTIDILLNEMQIIRLFLLIYVSAINVNVMRKNIEIDNLLT